MLLRDVPAVGVALAFILTPGILWAMLAYPSPSRIIRFGVGLALGLAIQVSLAAPLASTVGITQVSVVASTLITLVAAVALGVVMRVRAPRLPSQAAGRRMESSLACCYHSGRCCHLRDTASLLEYSRWLGS